MSHILYRDNLGHALPVAVAGDGPYLIDAAGKRYIDASSGAAVSCLGHQHPRVIEAITRQASKLAYAHTGFFSSEPAEALAAVTFALGGAAAKRRLRETEARLAAMSQYVAEKG